MNKDLLTYTKTRNKIYSSLPKPIIYSPSDYKIPLKYTGAKVKIAIIDSGCPNHKDIKITGGKNIINVNKNNVSFCNNTKNIYDNLGHSTIIAGIIKAKNKDAITGIAPNSQLYFAKVIDGSNYCSFNAIVAAILWAIIKKVDIITLSIGTQYNYQILHDAIKKAYNNGICIFATAGNKNEDVNYPAQYPEVRSVSFLKTTKNKVDFIISTKNIYTTYIKNEYVKTSGSSVANALVTGIASLLIEKNRIENKNYSSKTIYSELSKII